MSYDDDVADGAFVFLNEAINPYLKAFFSIQLYTGNRKLYLPNGTHQMLLEI